ncbi:DUF362 domain-containing protein [candidate division KSB1 bacterium]
MSEQQINRRDFLKRSTQLGISAAAVTGAGFWLKRRSVHPEKLIETGVAGNYRVDVPPQIPDMVVVEGEDPKQITTAAIEALGGMQTYVSTGDIVVLKPNIGWDRVPQQAANTNPELIECVTEHCFNAGAKKVIITDVSCNDARRCFRRSGIAQLASTTGADVLLPEDRKFKDFNLHGELLTIWPVYTPIIEADKVINLPIVKHHNLARATMGLKNWYGILGGRRNQLHQNIDISIADLASFIKPTLTILDAFRVLTANGPQGGNLNDVKLCKTVIAGGDPIAIDAYGASFLGLTADEIPYIQMAHERGLGNKDFTVINTKFIQL